MQTEQKNTVQQGAEEKEVYTFKREEGRWYICLATYLSHGWSKRELELTEGAHKVLNMLSNGAKKLRLRLGHKPFEGANVLELVEHCPAPKGGGIYLLNPEKQNHGLYWICDLALFVFGDIPDRIYVKRLPLRDKEVVKAAEFYPPKPDRELSWFKRGE
ncbi:MAG TPA: DUF6717 family protein [Flavisolibacter sp.]|jgi:hypothetical protein|nr:DUF6717 family protein [Flavisolibacter sp.]